MSEKLLRNKGRRQALTVVAAVGLALLVSFGCDLDGTGTGSVTTLPQAAFDGRPDMDLTFNVISHTDCKQSWSTTTTEDLPLNQTAVYWEYGEDGVLYLHHVNAGFNCCPELACEVDLTSNVITVVERDNGQCWCLCLLDVDYSVEGLLPGKYVLRFDEHVDIGDDQPLETEIIIKGAGSSGEVIVDRTCYPWEKTPDVAGTFIGFHGCGIENTEVVVPDYLFNRYCFTWEYDSDGLLKLGQHNAFVNCCMDTLYVTFEFSDNLIVIDEVDTLSYICPCLCAFGGDLEIYNLPVGEYTFQVHDPYYTTIFQFTVDLEAEPMGYFAPFVSSE